MKTITGSWVALFGVTRNTILRWHTASGVARESQFPGRRKVPTMSQVVSSMQYIYSQRTLGSTMGGAKLASWPGRYLTSSHPSCTLLPASLTRHYFCNETRTGSNASLVRIDCCPLSAVVAAFTGCGFPGLFISRTAKTKAQRKAVPNTGFSIHSWRSAEMLSSSWGPGFLSFFFFFDKTFRSFVRNSLKASVTFLRLTEYFLWPEKSIMTELT